MCEHCKAHACMASPILPAWHLRPTKPKQRQTRTAKSVSRLRELQKLTGKWWEVPPIVNGLIWKCNVWKNMRSRAVTLGHWDGCEVEPWQVLHDHPWCLHDTLRIANPQVWYVMVTRGCTRAPGAEIPAWLDLLPRVHRTNMPHPRLVWPCSHSLGRHVSCTHRWV